jgi:hypothetical protein
MDPNKITVSPLGGISARHSTPSDPDEEILLNKKLLKY